MDQEKTDTWSDLQALKLRQNRFREKRERRKKELKDIESGISSTHSSASQLNSSTVSSLSNHQSSTQSNVISELINVEEVESKLLSCLCDAALKLPIDSRSLLAAIRKFITLEKSDHLMIVNLLEKFAHQGLINIINDSFTSDGETCIIVSSADHSKLIQFVHDHDESNVKIEENADI